MRQNLSETKIDMAPRQAKPSTAYELIHRKVRSQMPDYAEQQRALLDFPSFQQVRRTLARHNREGRPNIGIFNISDELKVCFSLLNSL